MEKGVGGCAVAVYEEDSDLAAGYSELIEQVGEGAAVREIKVLLVETIFPECRKESYSYHRLGLCQVMPSRASFAEVGMPEVSHPRSL